MTSYQTSYQTSLVRIKTERAWFFTPFSLGPSECLAAPFLLQGCLCPCLTNRCAHIFKHFKQVSNDFRGQLKELEARLETLHASTSTSTSDEKAEKAEDGEKAEDDASSSSDDSDGSQGGGGGEKKVTQTKRALAHASKSQGGKGLTEAEVDQVRPILPRYLGIHYIYIHIYLLTPLKRLL